MTSRLVRASACGLVLAGCLRAAPAEADSPFARCDAAFEARPQDYASSNCFFQTAQQHKSWEEAARRLDALRDAHPRNFWLTLSRGNVEWTRDPDRALELYRLAAAGFAAEKNGEGEVIARYNLRILLYRKGRLDEAGEEVRLALKAAEASGEPAVLARAWSLEAAHLTDTGRDVSLALASLKRAERAAFPAGSYTLQRGIVFALGNACFQLGRFAEALAYFERVHTMAAQNADRLTLAAAQYSVVNTLMREAEELPRPGARDEIAARAEAALVAAAEADNRETQVMLHRTLGELYGGRSGRPSESRRHYEQCVAMARRLGQPRELAHCLWSLAGSLADEGLDREARRSLDEALALASGTGHVWSIAHASRQRLRVGWATLPPDAALAESLQSLAAIEAVRDLQQQDSAGVFSAWVGDYQWLAGRLLEAGRDRREALEQAFSVVERMRARALLDALRAARASPPDSDARVTERKAVLQQMVDVHRGLMDPGTAPAARGELTQRLDALEARELGLRQPLGRPSGAGPAFASLDEVERQLEPSEALLSYQLGLDSDLLGEPAGGGWVTVSTRSGTTAHRIAGRARLRDAVPVFLGLFAARDGREARPAAALYGDVVEPALASLPSGVDRLVVVPDDVLHALPFAALRAEVGAPVLAERFAITLAPSATLWLRWRRSQRPSAVYPALVLADPTPERVRATRDAPSSERGGLADGALDLGPLPHARREGRQVKRRLAGSMVFVGAAASESALKASRTDDYAVLHFATHALVDDEHPDRSSLLLAAGQADEDGLLQSREIAELPLSGRVVVLAACRSASGSLVAGEGVMSLARAFFQAGAHGVVGSLWPLRDDEAAFLLDAFYREAARGADLGASLASAQREAIRSGLPASAWAGLVVVGDAALVPFPGGVRGESVALRAGLVLGGVLALAALAFRMKKRRSPRAG